MRLPLLPCIKTRPMTLYGHDEPSIFRFPRYLIQHSLFFTAQRNTFTNTTKARSSPVLRPFLLYTLVPGGGCFPGSPATSGCAVYTPVYTRDVPVHRSNLTTTFSLAPPSLPALDFAAEAPLGWLRGSGRRAPAACRCSPPGRLGSGGSVRLFRRDL